MKASLQLWWEVCVLLCWQLLFKSISRCSCLVVCPFLYLECLGSFLVVARCNFIIVAGDSKLVVVFKGLSSCGGGISVLVVLGSFMFVSGGTYQFAVGARGSSKTRERIVWRGSMDFLLSFSGGGLLSSCVS